MTETVINFKPKSEWPAGTTKETILQRLDEKLRLPGVTNIWTQPIRNRIDMLSTGIRTQVGVKVFGNDLATIEQKSKLRLNVLCAPFLVSLISILSASPARRTSK